MLLAQALKHTAKNICSGSVENICETGYRYCDSNDTFSVQNVVKKPGCETFDIDFGERPGQHSAVKRKPELTRRNVTKKVPRSPSIKSPSKTKSRRPLRKVDNDVTSSAIRSRNVRNFSASRPNSVNFNRNAKKGLNVKPTTQGSCFYTKTSWLCYDFRTVTNVSLFSGMYLFIQTYLWETFAKRINGVQSFI